MPRTTPPKNGFAMSATITPIVCVTPVDMLRATAFARYPMRAAAASTRSRSSGLT